ncbi:hypothetical protein CDD83_14 [Cordyceps sp. RAO-2017]|nr:hypothetical protein CDD83_14 [Cordyceps sp. RAO-2017]
MSALQTSFLFVSEGVDWTRMAALLFASILVLSSLILAYNIFWHPLAHFPGPLHYGATIFPWAYHAFRGTLPFETLKMHNKFGPVVRISPGQLSFIGPAAWQDIYGTTAGGQNPKYRKFYQALGFNGIIAENVVAAEKDTHKVIRNLMIEQMHRKFRSEGQRLGGAGDTNRTPGMDIFDLQEWFLWATADIIGDLAFGESFNCLQQLKRPRFIALMSMAAEAGSKSVVLWSLGMRLVVQAIAYCAGGHLLEVLGDLRATLTSRIESGAGGDDLMEPLIAAQKTGHLTFDHVLGTASVLVIAGLETTVVSLTSFVYFMATNPVCLARLTREIRSMFPAEDEICLSKVEELKYLSACIKESLRTYTPAAVGMPRIITNEGRIIAGRYIPEQTVVSVSGYASTHSSMYFRKPFEFHPERFLGSPDFENDVSAASQPFSLGPRACIGKTISYATMRLVITKLLWNFDIESTRESRRWLDNQRAPLLWRKKPLMIKLKPVKRDPLRSTAQ